MKTVQLISISAQSPWTRIRAWWPWLVAGSADFTPRRASTTGDIDTSSFEAFFHRYEREIFGYLWRMTGEEQAAYDLSQEAFLRAWLHFRAVQGYELPGAWLFRVATNLALKYLRRSSVADRVTSILIVCMPAGADPAYEFAEADLICRVLLLLPPRQRAALVLHDVYGLTCQETAASLGITHAAAKKTLWRAREHFRGGYVREEERQ